MTKRFCPRYLRRLLYVYLVSTALYAGFGALQLLRRTNSLVFSNAYTHAGTTIVTAFFDISSKHTHAEYQDWMQNFFSLRDSMVVFTDAGSLDWIQTQRSGKERSTMIVETTLDNIDVSKMYSESFWDHQFSKDPEAHLHKSPKLFQVWLNKPFFVSEAIRRNPFKSEIFAWSDIGCFRDHAYNHQYWIRHPQLVHSQYLLAAAWQAPNETGVDLIIKSEHQETSEWFMAGTQLIGYGDTWRTFIDIYEDTLLEYEQKGLFIGDDQPILQTACRRGNICEYVLPHQVQGDTFFGLQEILYEGKVSPPWHRVQLENDDTHVCENKDFRAQHELAVFTMLTDDLNYVDGAIKLARSTQRYANIPVDLVYMLLKTKPIPKEQQQRLQRVGWKRCDVSRIVPLDEAGTFERFRDQFTKLHLWGMTVYKTILYMDSDTIVVQSITDLLKIQLDGKRIGAARDFGAGEWRPTFNMGVFLIHPNIYEYKKLLQLQKDPNIHFETAMCEQGFLNVIYEGKWFDIGFQNNANLAVFSQNHKFWEEHANEINIIHFTMAKPWDCDAAYAEPCTLWRAF